MQNGMASKWNKCNEYFNLPILNENGIMELLISHNGKFTCIYICNLKNLLKHHNDNEQSTWHKLDLSLWNSIQTKLETSFYRKFGNGQVIGEVTLCYGVNHHRAEVDSIHHIMDPLHVFWKSCLDDVTYVVIPRLVRRTSPILNI